MRHQVTGAFDAPLAFSGLVVADPHTGGVPFWFSRHVGGFLIWVFWPRFTVLDRIKGGDMGHEKEGSQSIICLSCKREKGRQSVGGAQCSISLAVVPASREEREKSKVRQEVERELRPGFCSFFLAQFCSFFLIRVNFSFWLSWVN